MVRFTNNASTKLAAALTNTATSFSVVAGTGVLYPNLSTGDWFYVTIVNESTNPGAFEIVKVTARSGDTFTVVRGQDNTTAQAFPADSLVSLRVTAQALEDVYMSSGNYLRKQITASNDSGSNGWFSVYCDVNAGNDNNDGLTAATPVKTLEVLLYKVLPSLDVVQGDVPPTYYPPKTLFIRLSAGTHLRNSYALDADTNLLNKWRDVYFIGTDINATIIQRQTDNVLSLGHYQNHGLLVFQHLTIVGAVAIPQNTSIRIENVKFVHNFSSAADMITIFGQLEVLGGCVFDLANSTYHNRVLNIGNGGYFYLRNNATVIGPATLATGRSFAYVSLGGELYLGTSSFTVTGGAITGVKWGASGGSISVGLGGTLATKFPGTINGSITNGSLLAGTNQLSGIARCFADGTSKIVTGFNSATRTATGTWNINFPITLTSDPYMGIMGGASGAGYTNYTSAIINNGDGTGTRTVTTYNSSGTLVNAAFFILTVS